jgi:iron complex outermembrane receptor protein
MGYLDFEYTSVNPVTGITLDMKAPFNGEWQASAGVQYVADFGLSGTLTPRVDWDYRSSFYNNAINNPFNLVAGRSIVNARLTYETQDGDWSVSGGVTNVFGAFYYNAINENVGAYGVATGVVGRPREWSVTVRRSF